MLQKTLIKLLLYKIGLFTLHTKFFFLRIVNFFIILTNYVTKNFN